MMVNDANVLTAEELKRVMSDPSMLPRDRARLCGHMEVWNAFEVLKGEAGALADLERASQPQMWSPGVLSSTPSAVRLQVPWR